MTEKGRCAGLLDVCTQSSSPKGLCLGAFLPGWLLLTWSPRFLLILGCCLVGSVDSAAFSVEPQNFSEDWFLVLGDEKQNVSYLISCQLQKEVRETRTHFSHTFLPNGWKSVPWQGYNVPLKVWKKPLRQNVFSYAYLAGQNVLLKVCNTSAINMGPIRYDTNRLTILF